MDERLEQKQLKDYIDDSDGFKDTVLDDIRKHIDKTYELANLEQKQQLLQELISYVEDSHDRCLAQGTIEHWAHIRLQCMKTLRYAAELMLEFAEDYDQLSYEYAIYQELT